jgi:uncharacterized protein
MTLEKWNSWWITGEIENTLLGTKRDFHTQLEIRHIKDIIGIRRSGKTTFLFQIIDDLLKQKVDPKKIVFLNLDDPNIKELSFKDLEKEIYSKVPNPEYLFLDEVQEKEGWEKWIRTNYDLKKFKQIFVTGSTCSLISKSIGRLLTGRHITIKFFPFSFKEYVEFYLKENINENFLEYYRNKILFYFKKYLFEGGFPETFNINETMQSLVLNNVYKDILSRDIASRYSLNYEKLEKISDYLMSNNCSEYSYRGVANKLNLSFETVEKYIGYLKDSFLFYDLKIFNYKLSEQLKKNKKIYTIDNGLANFVSFKFREKIGKLLENIVFLELKRRDKEIYYYKSKKNFECDFVIKEGLKIVQAIQVTKDMNDEKTRLREIRGLVETMKELHLRKGLILTEDEEDEFKIDGFKITVKPIWKWILEK